ncbi:hypothetical protein EV191_109186 [Tamaricihabitans halophyticus]|uniref:Uncharacterized protein n=1 Tax=Tamaricihabitans halophyticus TaxID=1262583 RepID=A0A4R2QKR2_9PSEU|nr:hypothetical protein EV191_109186 [Tamaricihabitans halophyticus]
MTYITLIRVIYIRVIPTVILRIEISSISGIKFQW